MKRISALVVVLAMCLLTAHAANATANAATTPAAQRPVAQTKAGELTSRIAGTTGSGRDVSGSFVPLKFVKRDGKLFVRGLVQGVVHERNGDRTTFSQLRTARVKSINGTPVPRGQAAQAFGLGTCDILHLTLGPLDLDLLGLRVHLDRVVLDIVAATGAGNLLGNLLCAVTGLLDGVGILAQLLDLLNQILDLLWLG